jgi:type IV pilus assembly protein PilW
MIAITIGFVILLGLSVVFYTSTVSRKETDRSARQIENGRYAMQVLSDDLKLAGYVAEFNPNILPLPASKPNPCLTTIADLKAQLPLHVQGYDNGAGLTTECTALLTDLRANTDVVVIRRATTCIAGAAGCDATMAGAPYFQAALCGSGTELASVTITDYFVLDASTGTFNKHKKDCATVADTRRYRTHIYFVTNNDNAGDGIPTLKRAELGATGFTIVPLVEGIENLQIEYGVDTNNDGTPDTFTADPDAFTYAACATAPCVVTWRDVMGVRINVLARNTEISPGWNDTKTYTLGKKADGTDNVIAAASDAIKRHAYEGQVRMNNPSARRLVP